MLMRKRECQATANN